MNITVPCSVAWPVEVRPTRRDRSCCRRSWQAPKAVDRGLLIQRANNDLVVVVRNTPVVVAPLNKVLSPACQKLTFSPPTPTRSPLNSSV